MRRIQLGSVFLLALFSTMTLQQALAGDKDAGTVTGDSIYSDNMFGFSLTKPATWKFEKTYGQKDIERVFLKMKNPTTLPQFADHRDYFTEPQITVLAAKVDKAAKDYKDLLFDPKYKDKLKSRAMQRFAMLQTDSKYSFEPQRDRTVKIGGSFGIRIDGRKQYSWVFEGGDILSDYISGRIYALEADSGLVLIECVCERELLDEMSPDFDHIVNSFVFQHSTAEPSEADTATIRIESKEAGQ